MIIYMKAASGNNFPFSETEYYRHGVLRFNGKEILDTYVNTCRNFKEISINEISYRIRHNKNFKMKLIIDET